MKPKLTLREVLEQLSVEKIEEDLSGFDVVSTTPGLPWYVRLFIGVSAWLAAIFLIGFLFLARLLQGQEEAIFIGLVFCAVAVGVNRAIPRNDFLGQLALALSLAGQVLLIIGLDAVVESVTGIALTLIALEGVLIWLYQDRVHRFISTLVIVGAVLAVIFDLKILEMTHLLIGALAVAALLFYWRENDLLLVGLEEAWQPVGYGVTVSVLGLLVLPLAEDFEARWWWLTAVLLLVTLLFLTVQIALDLGLELRSRMLVGLLAGCVVLLIPAVRMPGILGASILLLLGFWRNRRILIGLAAVFLVFYLGAYYYSLEWTLLVKSLALLGSGLTLVGLRYILLHLRPGSLA